MASFYPSFEGILKPLGEMQAKSCMWIVADQCDAALSEIIICGRQNNALSAPLLQKMFLS